MLYGVWKLYTITIYVVDACALHFHECYFMHGVCIHSYKEMMNNEPIQKMIPLSVVHIQFYKCTKKFEILN